VFVEASAFGVPSMGPRIGGISEVIRDGRNGYTFAANESSDVYADAIGAILKDPDRYEQLAVSSYREFRSRLTWDASLDALSQLLEQVTLGTG
jgi:glycosyltransferase involved in cell wall biosynthesis